MIGRLYLVLSLLVFFQLNTLKSQVVILTNIGASYTNSDAPTGPDVYSVDISQCSSISFSLDFSFSLPWEGSGNMESAFDCPFGPDPCLGDPTMPNQGACDGCWDYLNAEFFIDGGLVGGDLIGEGNTLDSEQSGVISSPIICTNNAMTASIEVVTQTWAANETASFTNISILCYQGTPEILPTVTSCTGGTYNLNGSAVNISDVLGWQWTTVSGSLIDSPNSQNTFASNASSGDVFVLETTDVNGCKSTDMVSATFSPDPVASPVFISDCSAVLNMYDLTTQNSSVNPTETVDWYLGPPNVGGTLITNPTNVNINPPIDLWALVIDANGCATQVQATVLLQGGATISWNVATDPVQICEGECVLLPMSISGGTPPYMIQFTGGINVIGIPISETETLNFSAVENVLTFCLNGGTFLDQVQWNDATNTVNVFPGIVDFPFSATSGTLTIDNITDATGCSTVVNESIGITLGMEPMASSTNLTECDDGSGQGTYDLTQAEVSILTGGTGTVTFYSDIAGTMLIANPTAYMSSGGVIYAQVTDAGCSSPIVNVNLILNPAEDPTFVFNDFCATDPMNGPSGIVTTGGTFTFSPDPGDGATIDANTGALSNVVAGTMYSVNYMTAGICPGNLTQTVTATAPMTVMLTAIPDLCETDPAINLNTMQGVVSGTWTGLGVTGNSFNPFGLGGLSVTLTFFPDASAGCFSSSDLQVNVILSTMLSDPGFSPICDSGNINLAGFIGVTTGTWSGPGVAANVFIPPMTGSNTYMITFTPDAASCIPDVISTITVEPSIVFTNPGTLSDCGSITLPTITTDNGTLLSGNELYYTGPLGTGISFAAGTTVSASGTYYVYDTSADPNCINNPSFTITILPAPDITSYPDPLQACNSVTLMAITGTNLSGSEAYYDGPGGTGSIIPVGTVITTDMTIYAYDESSPLCNDEEVLNIEIVSQINFVNPGNQIACPSYILPTINGSATALYYDMPNGGGMSYAAGDVITTDIILFIYDAVNTCVANNDESFEIDIVLGPAVNPIETLTYCDSFILETITGTDLTGSEAYFDQSNGLGTQYAAGDIIYSSLELYVYDSDGVCFSEDTFTVTIENSLSAGEGGAIIVCQGDTNPIDIAAANLGTVDAGGIWADVNPAGVDISNINAVDMSSLGVGMYDFSYSIDLNVCSDVMSVVQVNVVNSPNIGSDAMEMICNGGSNTVLDFMSLIGNPDTGGSWMQTSGISVIDFSNPSMVDFDLTTIGTYSFSYTIPSAGSCIGGQSVLDVTVMDSPQGAGNVMIDACVGSTLNLFNELMTTDQSGTFTDLLGTVLTADGMFTVSTAVSPQIILYNLAGNQLCGSATDTITLVVSNSLSAGTDQSQELCVGESLDLNNVLMGAAMGGSFEPIGMSPMLSGTTLTSITNDISNSYDYYYIVGDGLSCPLDSAMITVDVIDVPSADMAIVGAFDCQETCVDLVLDFMGSPGFSYGLMFDNPAGQSYTFNGLEQTFNQATIVLCNLNNTLTLSGPQVGAEQVVGGITDAYTIELISLADSKCLGGTIGNTLVFDPSINSVSIDIDGFRCADDQELINGTVYDINNPSGMESVPGTNGCDTMFTIDLQFFPENTIMITDTYCGNESVLIGGMTFDQDNKLGQVVLENMDVNGCDSIIEVDLTFLEDAENIIDALLCEGDSIIVNGMVYNSSTTDMQVIDNGAVNGCDSIIDVMITISQDAAVEILIVSVLDNTYELSTDISLDGLSYEWQSNGALSCTDCPNPTITIDQNTDVSLIIFDEDCIQNGNITLILESDPTQVYIPNVFSPDGDGNNDRFIPFSNLEETLIAEMSIYDRWGEKVYSRAGFFTSDPSAGWDGSFKGELLNPGVYIYHIKLLTAINLEQIEELEFSGDVTLIR